MSDLNSLSIEELRKKVQEKKANFSKSLKIDSSKILDKYTNIDELVRDLVLAQHETNDALNMTNKLLIALYLQEASDGSLVAKQPNGIIDTSAILEGLRGGDDYRTLNKIIHNETGDKTILEIKGSGIIDVIKFVSSNASVDNKDYSVRIRSDTTILYANTWAEFEARTPSERGMVCYEDDITHNEYLLIFKTIAYSENLTIEIYESNATLSLIQVKYHEKV